MHIFYAIFEIDAELCKNCVCTYGVRIYGCHLSLSCKREDINVVDPCAVAVKKFGWIMPVVVGHIPRNISALTACFFKLL